MLLEEKWDALVADFSNKELTNEFYQQLIHAYSGKKRFYHNLQHIGEFYRLFELYRREIEDPLVFQFAIWYHDFVYKTLHNSINEKLSARKAGLCLPQLGIAPERVQQVKALILDTKAHRIAASNGLADAPWFLDMDLAILGSDPASYEIYREQIRREYWVFPATVFRLGRSQALKRLLDRERIYHTEVFFAERESQARRNVQAELDFLRKQSS